MHSIPLIAYFVIWLGEKWVFLASVGTSRSCCENFVAYSFIIQLRHNVLCKILCVFMTALLNRTSADKLLLHHNN